MSSHHAPFRSLPLLLKPTLVLRASPPPSTPRPPPPAPSPPATRCWLGWTPSPPPTSTSFSAAPARSADGYATSFYHRSTTSPLCRLLPLFRRFRSSPSSTYLVFIHEQAQLTSQTLPRPTISLRGGSVDDHATDETPLAATFIYAPATTANMSTTATANTANSNSKTTDRV